MRASTHREANSSLWRCASAGRAVPRRPLCDASPPQLQPPSAPPAAPLHAAKRRAHPRAAIGRPAGFMSSAGRSRSPWPQPGERDRIPGRPAKNRTGPIPPRRAFEPGADIGARRAVLRRAGARLVRTAAFDPAMQRRAAARVGTAGSTASAFRREAGRGGADGAHWMSCAPTSDSGPGLRVEPGQHGKARFERAKKGGGGCLLPEATS